MNAPRRRCAIYARISVTKEESVSLARQVEAAEQYAAARGWAVAATFVDDGVSASSTRPEDRDGWRELLASRETFDAVVVWKVDRLARRVLDFLHADEALRARGAGVVAVEQSVDMTTAEGRGFATMLAVFGEMEAAAIGARVAGARRHLVQAGRVVGGTVPYGWRSVPNPAGPGLVLAQDPETAGWVRGMADRARAGDTLYSVKLWLDAAGAPLPASTRGRAGGWHYSTVERVLRHPVLAGMTPYNPGRTKEKTRGPEVLRDAAGLPVVVDGLGVMAPAEWRAMVARLDDRDSAQSRPRAACATTSSLLSGLVWCGEHGADPVRMHRGTRDGRHGYSCPSCHQTVTGFEDVVVEEFLAAKGERERWRVVEVVREGGAAALPEIEHRLDELATLVREAPDRAAREALQAQQADLLDLRDARRAEEPEVTFRSDGPADFFARAWDAASTVAERRAVLDDGLARVTVTRGGRGRRTRAQLLARLSFEWRGETGPAADHDGAPAEARA